MSIFSRFGLTRKSQEQENHQTLAEIMQDAPEKTAAVPGLLVQQVVSTLSELVDETTVYPCAAPDFKCEYLRDYMPFFEKDDAHIKIAFDEKRVPTQVCGQLARIHKVCGSGEPSQSNAMVASMPKCQVSQSISEVMMLGLKKNFHAIKKTNHHMDANSMLLFEDGFQNLREREQEWLDMMLASLSKEAADNLVHLMKYSIKSEGFTKKLENFLSTKKVLQEGSCTEVTIAFKNLATEFPIESDKIIIPSIGLFIAQSQDIDCEALFRVLVELFFCMGYDKEIVGYTTGFTDVNRRQSKVH
ncbi:MAG: hypothetical protein KUG75_02950 [Pseudomonadales bacterium]|nr:hypothetical protein [Pseudomonadales bacterium]